MTEGKPDLVTIDVNVVRDFLNPKRDGHERAVELFARNGSEVELAIAAQGHRLDADGLLGGELHEALRNEGIAETRQLAYLSEETYPSEDLFPGQVVDGFKEAWEKIVDSWRTHEGKAPQSPDDFHVEAHLLDERDCFLTEDRALRVMCGRLHYECGFAIVAITVGEYLERLGAETE
jgi:hypothetical protein